MRIRCIAFDLMYAAKEFSRGMTQPTAADLQQLTHVDRYPTRKGRVAVLVHDQVYGEGEKMVETMVTVLGDTTTPGAPVNQPSANGGVLFEGTNPRHTWWTTRATVAMSSGETELSGCVKAYADALAVVSG